MTNEKFQKYVDSVCYPPNISLNAPRRRMEIERAVKNIPDAYRNRRVLMLGCGDGHEVRVLKDRGFVNVVGLTHDREEFRNASDSVGGVVRGEMHELPFCDGEFDFVYSKETLEHSVAPYIALCELSRVSKIGAGFIHYIAEGIEKQSEWYHLSCFPPYVWVDLFYLAGFQVNDILSEERGIQSAYYGIKVANKDLNGTVRPYNLNRIIKSIRKRKFEL